MSVFIETKLFTKLIVSYLPDEDYAKFQGFLNEHPESGDIIPNSGGVRKLRWNRPGKGKRGGLRIIYYLRTRKDEIWLLTVYSKNEKDNIQGHVLKQIKEEINETH